VTGTLSSNALLKYLGCPRWLWGGLIEYTRFSHGLAVIVNQTPRSWRARQRSSSPTSLAISVHPLRVHGVMTICVIGMHVLGLCLAFLARLSFSTGIWPCCAVPGAELHGRGRSTITTPWVDLCFHTSKLGFYSGHVALGAQTKV
jgi:hypothetical protein